MQVDKNNIAVVKRLMKSVIVLLGAAMLTLTGCSKYKEIRPTSFKLESVSIHGLRSVDLEVSVGVNNPAGQLTISDFSGEVEHSGKVLGKLSLAPLVLMPRKDTVYRRGPERSTTHLTGQYGHLPYKPYPFSASEPAEPATAYQEPCQNVRPHRKNLKS